jgi:hypothetical protein
MENAIQYGVHIELLGVLERVEDDRDLRGNGVV